MVRVEINEILRRRPRVSVERQDKTVAFTIGGKDQSVTEKDMTHADRQYRKEFAVALAQLRK